MTSTPPGHAAPRRRGLGRGLDALLGPAVDALRPDTAVDASPDTAVLVEIDPSLVRANPEQPRRDFDHDSLVALGESIRTHGLLHPIVVERSGPGYQLVAGERRLRVCRVHHRARIVAERHIVNVADNASSVARAAGVVTRLRVVCRNAVARSGSDNIQN